MVIAFFMFLQNFKEFLKFFVFSFQKWEKITENTIKRKQKEINASEKTVDFRRKTGEKGRRIQCF